MSILCRLQETTVNYDLHNEQAFVLTGSICCRLELTYCIVAMHDCYMYSVPVPVNWHTLMTSDQTFVTETGPAAQNR